MCFVFLAQIDPDVVGCLGIWARDPGCFLTNHFGYLLMVRKLCVCNESETLKLPNVSQGRPAMKCLLAWFLGEHPGTSIMPGIQHPMLGFKGKSVLFCFFKSSIEIWLYQSLTPLMQNRYAVSGPRTGKRLDSRNFP